MDCKKIYKKLTILKKDSWLQAIRDYLDIFYNNEEDFYKLQDCIELNKNLKSAIRVEGLKKGYLKENKKGEIKVTLYKVKNDKRKSYKK